MGLHIFTASEARGAHVSMIVVCTVTLGVRLLARFSQRGEKRCISQSDIWSTVALCFIVAGGGLELKVLDSQRTYEDELAPNNLQNLLLAPDLAQQLAIISTTLHNGYDVVFLLNTSIWLVKASFVVMYFELFANAANIFRNLKLWLWCTAAYLAVTYLITVVLLCTVCRPIDLNWSVLDNCSVAISPQYFASQFTFCILADFLIVLFPAVLFSRMNLGRRKTVAFFFVLSVGSISIIATILRFAVVVTTSGNLSKQSTSGNSYSFWAALEILAGYVASCLPSFRVLLRAHKSPKPLPGSGGSDDRMHAHAFDHGRVSDDVELMPPQMSLAEFRTTN